MMVLNSYGWILCFLSTVLANPLENLSRFGPCIKTIDTPECNTNLAESFKPKRAISGINKPETWVFLFTPTNPDVAEPLHKCGGYLPEDSTYDPDADTEIFIHGWLDGVCRTGWMREMKEQIYQRQERDDSTKYNVILIDWSWGNFPDYFGAATNCKVMAEQTAFVIKNIMKEKDVSADKFHLIGHSLGAVASGFVGRGVKGLRRITALDPAYAPVGKAPPNQRVTYRDAKIVDVIHTNGGNCLARALGDERTLGHADFYPNGGKLQLSCYVTMLQSFLKGDILYALASLNPNICSHMEVLQFYKASINNEGVEHVGVARSSYRMFKKGVSTRRRNTFAVMGMNCERYMPNPPSRGQKFFLDTSLVCPYYDGSYVQDFNFPFNTSLAS